MQLRLLVCLISAAALACSAPVGHTDNTGLNSSPASVGNPITECEIQFMDAGATLSGTLFIPQIESESDQALNPEQGEQPQPSSENAPEPEPNTRNKPPAMKDRPAVVILGGAERGPRSMYKILVGERFAKRGIAALIYDSPGSGSSPGNAILQTKADRVREALAALRFLKSRDGIHSEQVGLFGFSEGAGIALLAAARSEDVAFVLPASGGWGVPLMEISRYRIETWGREQGLSQEEIEKAILFENLQYTLLAGVDLVDWPAVEKQAGCWPDEPWLSLIELTRQCRRELTAEEKTSIKSELEQVLNTWKTEPWFSIAVVDTRKYEQFVRLEAGLFFQYLENGPLARGDWRHHLEQLGACSAITCPVMAVWGENDRFVPVNPSAAALKSCLAGGGNEDFTLRIIPGTGHRLTIPGKGLEFAGDYPDLMAGWILERCAGMKEAR